MIDKAGVYELSMDEYQADPCVKPSLSSGIAHRLVTQSPLHAWFAHPKLNPNYKSEEATQFDLGACAHALLLEGEESIAVIDADDWRTKTAKDERAKARFEGKIPVLAHKMDACRSMAAVARKALLECPELSIDLSTGDAERVLVWREGDVWCRARPDWMSSDRAVLLDYKSTSGSAEPNAWIRSQMTPMGYDMQYIHYRRGNEMTGGPRGAQFVFLVQENYEPYACSFVGVSPAKHELADRKRDFAVALWQSCMKTKKWSGYPNDIAYADPAAWEIDADGDRGISFEHRLELAAQG